ncbi:DAP1 [Cyberlindnera jadinii]|uniref:DAP1 protein n=2 Tax=Cyberlindnera jadinii (strain ATCC 18201 / CBS 1600 / BCRC 20928 / JCM 3617 / NBRC 0987 / NRRL Y-1542) TaxID=983966 RepID=A0A0H5CKR1_CYBJN|nr:DAP1 [Cyberlindnera jadinii]
MSFIKDFFFPVKTSDPTAEGSNAGASKDPIVQGLFTPRVLSRYNGHDDERIFIAVKGTVYDCTQGRQFYGPSGPYSNFAGHDASRGLALNSFELENVPDWDQPLDKLDDLQKEDIEALDGWEAHFQKKYPVVGKLVAENQAQE